MNYYKYKKRFISLIRQFSSVKTTVKLDENVSNDISNSTIKPRYHPGRTLSKTIHVPNNIIGSIQNILEDHPAKSVIEDCKILIRYLKARLTPVEKNHINVIKREVTQEILNKYNLDTASEEKKEKLLLGLNGKIQERLKQKIYNWTPIQYNEYNSLLYLLGRFAPDYAALVRVLYEISIKDLQFKPRSLFDFGSGVGTVTWAAKNYWDKNLFEYFNVDSSAHMNDLAQLMLKGGRGTTQVNLKGVFYRQFLPANNIAYDLVVCSYSLLELPSRRARLQTILNLWNKTSQYLVVVEQGSNAGFQIVNEVREFILNIKDGINQGYVFSPCPHDASCPRILYDDTPCNFEVSYASLPLGAASKICKERYCYIVLKKGSRNEDDPQWPRIVREPLVRSRHTICRLCTKEGKLDEIIFTASKHGKVTYHCARSSKWGDLLPISVDIKEIKDDSTE
ncbi:hypothetical protein RN001_000517 [Aquatica leii]|uniref:Methyltransferase-like protein 17, mitochondrial n=1 Tax=Aquatica leii TaxID=1421715 RepID=A0AAN7PK85_9COLE|nr:hypothetical protein RN001_000517 [Aquatica leii]